MAFPRLLMKYEPPQTTKKLPLLNPTSKSSLWCLMGPICSTCVHSKIHLHYMCKIEFLSVQPFDHISQSFELLTPYIHPKCRPGLSWSELFLAYVHFQMNPQTRTKFGANRSSL